MTDPLDHIAFLRSLPADTRLKLLVRSNRAGLMHLALHWGLILVVGTLIWAKIPYWPLLLPVQGILLIFNFTLLHECTHQTPFRSTWLNEVVGWITGFVVGLPFLWFRYFHLAHHKHTNDPARDPELLGNAKPSNRRQYFWHISGLPTWAAQITGLVKIAIGRDALQYVPISKRLAVKLESIIIVIFYIFIAFYSLNVSTIILTLWILPVFMAQPLLRLYLMAEHGRCPAVANMLENSRTTYTNRIVRFLSWNMPYHAEHHSLPNVPFYQLPALNQMIKAHLKTTEDGYAKFHVGYLHKGFSASGQE